ncbi:hypothetical protein IAI18_02820 [Acetobacteraceae bacterium H6797]|nr:hypothetical protein [Acetobacteraceae bacterium H6797]
MLPIALLILAALLCLAASRQPERPLRAMGMGGSIIIAMVAALLALHADGTWQLLGQLPGNRPRIWYSP